MPLDNFNSSYNTIFGEDVQEIIEEVPSWILRWGVSLFFGILISIIGLAALIRYPDIVNASLKIDSPDSPKPIVSKISGKLVKLLKKENDLVRSGETLAFMESTENHLAIIGVLDQLRNLQEIMREDKTIGEVSLRQINNGDLGELQGNYQTF